MNEFRNNMKEKESGRYFKRICVNKDESELFIMIHHAMKNISTDKYKKPLITMKIIKSNGIPDESLGYHYFLYLKLQILLIEIFFYFFSGLYIIEM